MIATRRTLAAVALAAVVGGLPSIVEAHAAPEILVRGEFPSSGSASLEVEIDPRCFAKDPLHALYLKKPEADKLTDKEREALFAKAQKLIDETLRFHFEPAELAKPKFKFRLEERPDADPDEDGGIPVMILAKWKADELTDLKTYQLEALKTGDFSVHFINRVNGKKQELHVLFPGEKSYRLRIR